MKDIHLRHELSQEDLAPSVSNLATDPYDLIAVG